MAHLSYKAMIFSNVAIAYGQTGIGVVVCGATGGTGQEGSNSRIVSLVKGAAFNDILAQAMGQISAL